MLETVRRRAFLVAGSALIGVACSLSGLDGLSGGTDPIDASPESATVDGPSEASLADASIDVAADAADAADAALTEGCQGDPACSRVVFVTNATFATSDFGSLAGADALCERVANGVNATVRVRNRPMRAWLSTAAESAASRLVHGTMPYVRNDGKILASSFTTLVTKFTSYNVDVDETGNDLPAAGSVWTGTMKNGTSDDMLCNDWMSTAANVFGLSGFTSPYSIDAGPEIWTFDQDKPCDSRLHLYCVER